MYIFNLLELLHGPSEKVIKNHKFMKIKNHCEIIESCPNKFYSVGCAKLFDNHVLKFNNGT